MKLFIDIDGVIADNSARLVYLEDASLAPSQRWSEFLSTFRVTNDLLIPAAKVLNDVLVGGDVQVFFLTGRPEKLRETTSWWLAHFFSEYHSERHPILMRPDDDYSKSYDLKVREIEKHIAPGEFFVFIDDEPANRVAVAKSFPKCEVFDPVEGWQWVKQRIAGEHARRAAIAEIATMPVERHSHQEQEVKE